MSGSGVAGWVVLAALLLLGGLVLQLIHLSAVLAWGEIRTRGLEYYGLPPAGRARFRRVLGRHARILSPILFLLARLSTFRFSRASFRHSGIAFPRSTCSEETVGRALRYSPRPEDVFVVTQMRSGTTWMQHLVYEVVHRGAGDLAASDTALYAVSPWLESEKTVSVHEAPLLGRERPTRLIKTHLPARLCPRASSARYICVVRHPLACFASCRDFLAAAAGPFAPDLHTVERWFCSSDMWWGPWPAHVAGWWRRAEEGDAVLVVTFEEMRRDLAAVVRRVTAHLGLDPLADDEIERVVHKCGLAYMRRHAEAFEMHPPSVLAPRPRPFVSGGVRRRGDVPDVVRERILDWCAGEIEGSGFPTERFYPDLPAPGTPDTRNSPTVSSGSAKSAMNR